MTDDTISYRIASGNADVFVIPTLDNGKQCRLFFLGRAGKGTWIPGVNIHCEIENEKAHLNLLISPNPSVTLEKAETPIGDGLTAFLEEIGYKSETGDLFLDYCKRQASEDRLIAENIKHHHASVDKDNEIIVSAFKEDFGLKGDRDGEEELLYQAMSFLAKKTGIKLADQKRIKAQCEGEYDIQDIARASDFLCRKVDLDPKWYKGDFSPCICYDEKQIPYAVYRDVVGRRRYYDPVAGVSGKLRKKRAESFESAYCIHRSLNDPKLDVKSITKFAIRDFSIHDIVVTLFMTLLITSVNIELSSITEMLYDQIIPQGNFRNLVEIGGILILYTLGSVFFTLTQSIATFRQNSRVKYSLQAAIYNRVFHMPESFYRKYDAGEIAYRCSSATGSYYSMINAMVQIILQVSFSVLYFVKMKSYSPELSMVVLLSLLAGMVLSIVINYLYLKYQRGKAKLSGKLKAYLYEMFSGIKAIRSFGGEDTVLSEYLKQYSEWNVMDYNYGKNARILSAKNTCISAFIMFWIYHAVAKGEVVMSTGSFLAFISIYATFSMAMLSVTNNISTLYTMYPLMKSATTVLKTPPELCNEGRITPRLEGNIRIRNLRFGYTPEHPILSGLNLDIKKGEYVAIVGATGCGKSTLLRLLLGFEKPSYGKIYYDEYDLQSLNKPQFRKRIRVVLQDGGLFAGSIYKNIQLSNPNVTMEQINEAIERVGLKDDIEKMPMGIMTPVSEEASTISGGQKQRILIARAIVGNPDILFLDEATSALDNKSQAEVIDAIEKMQATRVVIAHRLSTLLNCDRVIVLDKGCIQEEGTYQELIEKNGIFAKLVKNQMA